MTIVTVSKLLQKSWITRISTTMCFLANFRFVTCLKITEPVFFSTMEPIGTVKHL